MRQEHPSISVFFSIGVISIPAFEARAFPLRKIASTIWRRATIKIIIDRHAVALIIEKIITAAATRLPIPRTSAIIDFRDGMKSNPEFQEAKSDPIGENADSRCSQRFVRRCLRWGERALILALLFFTIRVAFTNVAETAAAESVPLEESSPSRVAQNGEANRQHGPRDSDANQKSDAARAPVANAPTPVEEPPSKRSKREPGPAVDEPEPAVAKGDKIKERTGKRLGILRLNGDHASDIEAVYSEAALVWGLGG